jgi:hypothetical protein
MQESEFFVRELSSDLNPFGQFRLSIHYDFVPNFRLLLNAFPGYKSVAILEFDLWFDLKPLPRIALRADDRIETS